MNKMFVFVLAAGAFLVLLLVGRAWKLKPDTPERHVVHKGEPAILISPGGPEVWLARDQRQCYPLQVAMTRKDAASLKNWETRDEAFPVPVGTEVKVVGESVSARQIEIADGALAGKTGWVEFEYLRPPKAGEAH